MGKVEEIEQRGIGRIKLTDTQELVRFLVGNEKLDLRVWVESDTYRGWTKQGFRLYLFEGNCEEFKKLIEKVDKAYEEIT